MEKQANDLSKYRYEKAVQCVNSARYVMGIKDYNLVSNRAYYAIFHAMRAVLALEEKDFAKVSKVLDGFAEFFQVEIPYSDTESFVKYVKEHKVITIN